VFKKHLTHIYGAKVEIYGDSITIKRERDLLLIEAEKNDNIQKRRFQVNTIQLLYLGEWNT
jgi:hypothetical protein